MSQTSAPTEAAPNRPNRSHKLSKSTSGPSRIDNKRQTKIVAMVDGYDSTVSISAGFRNVLLVWILPGIGMLLASFIGLVRPGRSSFGDDVFNTTLLAIQAGMALLSLVTIIVAIIWAVRTWSNIRRLGKRAKIGALDVMKRHFIFFVSSVGLGLLSLFLESIRVPLLVVSALTMFLAFSFIPFLILALVRLFWRSGSPPIGLEEELPHFGLIWFVTWFAYSTLAGSFTEYAGFSLTILSTVLLVAGFSCIVAAVTGAKLVTQISRRHDERLLSIISNLDLERDGKTEVTSSQIESAWENSESLVSFDEF
ncbi:MAG: hypothetical protein ACI8TP_001280 [Acidimicrobiales bacterium]